MAIDARIIGERIHDRRLELNLSLTKVALDLHISPDYLRKIKYGTRHPSLDIVLSLADYLGITTDYLLRGEKDPLNISAELGAVIRVLQKIQKIV